jgi:hypothetical protein
MIAMTADAHETRVKIAKKAIAVAARKSEATRTSEANAERETRFVTKRHDVERSTMIGARVDEDLETARATDIVRDRQMSENPSPRQSDRDHRL